MRIGDAIGGAIDDVPIGPVNTLMEEGVSETIEALADPKTIVRYGGF